MCSAEFEVQVKPGERVVQYSQEAACPYCLNTPGPDISSTAVKRWHQIIGLRKAGEKPKD